MAAWEILEIEPTGDTKAIKRAYAKKLKVTRPDENPKGFQDLHDAYKRALQQAEWIARRQAEETFDEDEYDEEEDDWDDAPLAETEDQLHIHRPEAANYLPELFDDEDPPQKNNPPEIHTPIVVAELLDSEDSNQKNPVDSPLASEIESREEIEIPDQPTEPIINPYQLEGERLIETAKLLLATDGEQAHAESWSFILESPFILDDQFNWRLGLEILLLIREQNISHSDNISINVGANAMTYLDSIFNWNANRPQVFRALGNEYASLLDMIRDSSQPDNWKDKIRGGKKITLANQIANIQEHIVLAGPFKRFFAYLLDWLLLVFVIFIMAQDQPDLSPLFSFTLLPLLYFTIFEFSKLQGTIGKRLLKLRVTKTNTEPMSFIQTVSRSVCFFVYQGLFTGAAIAASAIAPFAAVVIVGAYIYSCSKNPVLLYDKITQTRVIGIKE